jgi:nucleotide-binding universal stress UspA family protein
MDATMNYKRILVPVDGSSTSNAGLREALKLARGGKATLCLLNIMDEHLVFSSPEIASNIGIVLDSMRAGGKRVLKGALRTSHGKGVKVQSVLAESFAAGVADTVVRQAKRWKADLIVMGTHGRSGLKRLILGSDAEQVVRRTGIPVLLVHGRAPAKRKAAGRKK